MSGKELAQWVEQLRRTLLAYDPSLDYLAPAAREPNADEREHLIVFTRTVLHLMPEVTLGLKQVLDLMEAG